jgi:hypothetical protein
VLEIDALLPGALFVEQETFLGQMPERLLDEEDVALGRLVDGVGSPLGGAEPPRAVRMSATEPSSKALTVIRSARRCRTSVAIERANGLPTSASTSR